MRTLFINRLLALVLFSLYVGHALSFGQTGHRITGAIGDKYLSSQTRLAIQNIIGNESLAEASTFVDEMRSDPSYFWQKQASAYHYVTIPKGKSYQEVGAPPKGDAIFALNKYSNVILNETSSKAEKALAVKFIVHIIGDLHQPFHVGNGTDRGGNDVKLKFFGHDSNLHRVWDSEMINKKQLSFTEWTNWLNRTITPAQVRQWSSIDPNVWINESIEIRDHAYPKSNSVKYLYLYNNLPIEKLRLKQAGIRIASYLNALFKKVK